MVDVGPEPKLVRPVCKIHLLYLVSGIFSNMEEKRKRN